jgi:hypothetical protein
MVGVGRDQPDQTLKNKPNRTKNMNQDYESRLLHHVAEFNKKYALVLHDSRVWIARENEKDYELIKQTELSKIYQNTKIQTGTNRRGDPVYKNHLVAWVTHPQCRVYRGGIVSMPKGEASNDYLNIWPMKLRRR